VFNEAIFSRETEVRLSIPSIVFVEIYEKWLSNEEFCRKFYYEVFMKLRQSPNIEIKPLDQEVLEYVIANQEVLPKQEMHDRIVLASAMSLKCILFTTDKQVKDYVRKTGVLPGVWS